MNKDFVPYEQALELNELGAISKLRKHPSILYQQAFRWFRDEHSCYHYIEPIYLDGKPSYEYCVVNSFKDEKEFNLDDVAHTYEEAELECLKKLIEAVKIK